MSKSVNVDVENVIRRLSERVGSLTAELCIAESTRDAALAELEAVTPSGEDATDG